MSGFTKTQERFCEITSWFIVWCGMTKRDALTVCAGLASAAHWHNYQCGSWRQRLDQLVACAVLARYTVTSRQHALGALTAASYVAHKLWHRCSFTAYSVFRFAAFQLASLALGIRSRQNALLTFAYLRLLVECERPEESAPL